MARSRMETMHAFDTAYVNMAVLTHEAVSRAELAVFGQFQAKYTTSASRFR